MSKSDHPTKADAGKTKRQLIDELNSLRHRLSELAFNRGQTTVFGCRNTEEGE